MMLYNNVDFLLSSTSGTANRPKALWIQVIELSPTRVTTKTTKSSTSGTIDPDRYNRILRRIITSWLFVNTSQRICWRVLEREPVCSVLSVECVAPVHAFERMGLWVVWFARTHSFPTWSERNMLDLLGLHARESMPSQSLLPLFSFS